MKKTSIYLIAFVFIALSNLNAACPIPLSWDYPNVPFIGENNASTLLSFNPKCVLHYKYCFRETPAYYDFAITEVRLEGDCAQFKNIDTLIKYATRDLITNKNPWGVKIPECPEISNKFWRQSTAACFTDFFWDPVTLQWVSYPCGDDGQERWCWTYYQYCWKWEGPNKYLQETIVNRQQGGPACPGETSYGMKCNQRCQ